MGRQCIDVCTTTAYAGATCSHTAPQEACASDKGALRMSFRLKAITREDHLAFVGARPAVSHMQVPSWGDVKPDRRAESLG